MQINLGPIMLSVNSLSFSFQHDTLFTDVSFDINAGELMHLTGANGAGKSTLMSIVAGIRSPDSGEISLLDNNKQPVEDLKLEVEYLSAEANGLYTKMDATQNLNFWASLRGLKHSDEIIHQELSKWGLGHRLIRNNFPVGKFSTGMRRRLALARVNLSNCRCWLLDEPIYGLDAKGISLFQTMLKQHKEQGGIALVISHDTAPLEGLITSVHPLEKRR
jgi:heme exporter protein A